VKIRVEATHHSANVQVPTKGRRGEDNMWGENKGFKGEHSGPSPAVAVQGKDGEGAKGS